MVELRNDENLTTADIANPPKATAVEQLNPEPANGSQPVASPAPTSTSGPSMNVQTTNRSSTGALFPDNELHDFRGRWDQVQTSFVDEPRQAVEQADSLVANIVKRIAEQFAAERTELEKQWDRGENVNTEDLRQALKRYRAFFDRLLSF